MKYLPYLLAPIAGLIAWLFFKREQSLKESIAKKKYELTLERYTQLQGKEKKSESEFNEAKIAYRKALDDYNAAVSKRKQSNGQISE